MKHPDFRSYTFNSELWKWVGKDGDKGSWIFLSVPKKVAREVKKMTESKPRKGFGSVPVLVTIGRSRWRTSIFPDSQSGTYVLPVKKAVRNDENIDEGSKVDVKIELVGVER